jgi:glycine dehydrogenase
VFTPLDTFLPRHVGPRERDVQDMLATLGFSSLDAFIDETIPRNVRVPELTDSEADGNGLRPLSELELNRRAEEVAAMNKGMKSYIGMGWVGSDRVSEISSHFGHLSSLTTTNSLV